MQTLRFADSGTAARYPLPVAGAADWQVLESTCQVVLELPLLGPGTIVVPSLTFATTDPTPARPDAAPLRHVWTLACGEELWQLQEVPSRGSIPPTAGGARSPGKAVSTHLDCFHIHQPLRAARLTVRLEGRHPPQRYLLCASFRALTVAVPPLPQDHRGLALAPRPRSQLTAPADMAQRICSPTCVSMILDLWQRPHDWLALAAECHDPATDLYGIWPLALAAAARRDCLGAVEVFADWQAPLQVLGAGVPLVTSIRFDHGELPGAPIAETGGHLVVVHGADRQWIRVCDPAAPALEVNRRYPAEAFSQAWLRHRGAAYILPA